MRREAQRTTPRSAVRDLAQAGLPGRRRRTSNTPATSSASSADDLPLPVPQQSSTTGGLMVVLSPVTSSAPSDMAPKHASAPLQSIASDVMPSCDFRQHH